jgi:hypothetical protein
MPLDNLTALTQVVPVLVLLLKFKKLDENFKLFGLLCAYGLFTDVVSYFCLMKNYDVASVQNIYSIGEMSCLFFLLHRTIAKPRVSAFILAAYIISLFSWIGNLVALKGFDISFQYSDTIYSFFISAFAAVSLLNIASVTQIPLLKNSYYMRSLGWMFYFSSAVLLYSLHYVSFSSDFFIKRVWDIHAIVNGMANLIFALSLWQNAHVKQQLHR